MQRFIDYHVLKKKRKKQKRIESMKERSNKFTLPNE